MKAVTIDQLGIEIHERYAKDQEVLDDTLIQQIPPHSEILGISSIYSSELEKLFEYNQCNLPWATFTSPPNSAPSIRRGLFSFCLIPSIKKICKDKENQEQNNRETKELEEENITFFEEKERLINVQIPHPALVGSLEKERSILFTLLRSIEELNDLVREINSHKLQYQKG